MSGPTGVRIRDVTPQDAEPLARMWEDFGRYLRDLGDTDEHNFGIDAILRDGFGPDPAFSGIIAEREGNPCGYLLYHFGYDVDRATRVMFVIDLWVDAAERRHGSGRALMREAAVRCRARGEAELLWAVFAPNKLAIAFYQRLGRSSSRVWNSCISRPRSCDRRCRLSDPLPGSVSYGSARQVCDGDPDEENS